MLPSMLTSIETSLNPMEKNDDRAKARYKMYLKALESADACAKAYGY